MDKAIWEATSGSITSANPVKFLKDAEQKGWRIVLEDLWGKDSTALMRTISPNRVAWKYLLNMDSSWRVLDIGAGTGGIACQLAKECSVVAVDYSQYNVEFMKLRAKQEGLQNFHAIEADAILLPLEPGRFDLAVIIGALEWIPFNHPNKLPREVQLQALGEACRVLKPGGKLFLGIENAEYFGYFLGVPEPHTNLKYISLLDRKSAGALSQDLRKQPYSELTHSKTEYINLLKEAGFGSVETYWLYPDYAFINYIIPLDHPNLVRYFIEEHLSSSPADSIQAILYRLYRFLEPEVVSDHVQFYGFLCTKEKE